MYYPDDDEIFNYSKKISFRSKAYPSSKHNKDQKAKIEMKSRLK